MKNIAIVAILLGSVGCAQLPQDPYWKAEAAWQVGHVVDVMQTVNGPAQDECYQEVNPFTRQLIGKNPSTGEVIGWGVGTGLLHYGMSKSLERLNAPNWLKIGWQSVSLTTKAYTVINNHNEGIRPWGDNKNGCR